MQSPVLQDTPYSLPTEANAAVTEMRQRMRTVRRELGLAVAEARRMGLVKEMDRAHAYWTVFESNSIEFEGPDLSGTVQAIESAVGQKVLADLNVNLLPHLLKQDARAFAAIGLEMARVLGLRYIGSGSTGMAQTDLRALHSVVTAGRWFAGHYRGHDVGISDSDHLPFPTYEIPRAMRDLADWTRRPVDPEFSVMRAAIGHAWFTHIHPFYDGNGRVARLFTNVLLGQDGLPPAIVKAKSQRNQYIGALAHSDEGGDIMPLTGLFLDTVERYVAELRRPATFQRLFRDLVARRGDSYFDWYISCLGDFYNDLENELGLHGLELLRLDDLSADVFSELRSSGIDGWRDRAVMAALIFDREREQEIALYFKNATNLSRGRLTADEHVPTLGFAVPNARWQLSQYRSATRGDLQGLRDFWVQPDRNVEVALNETAGVRRMRSAAGASRIADILSAGFKRDFRKPANHYESARWLSKVNGGPG